MPLDVRLIFSWLLLSLAAAGDPSDILHELIGMHAQIEAQQVHLQSQMADLQRQQLDMKQRLAALSARGASSAIGVAAAGETPELKAAHGRWLSAATGAEQSHTLQDQIEELKNSQVRAALAVPARSLSSFAVDAEDLDAVQAHIEELENGPIKVALLSLVHVAASIRACIDYVWLLLCGALVMSMQAGFAVLEAGTCRRSSAGMILLKNIMDAAMGAIVWFMFGYAFAYGTEDPNEFIGTAYFFGRGIGTDHAHHRDWFFQWAFCATSATIVSGAVAERIQFRAYLGYASLMTAFIYPVIVYWAWSGEGFLTRMGFSDFAGSGVVHLTGGTAALVSALILGPRAGRFEDDMDVEASNKFVPNDLAMVVLGTLLLWFGWYGFNCGSTLSVSTLDAARSAALVAMNTTLSAAAGGVTVIVFRALQTGKLDMARSCNGILAGLVSCCAACDSMEPGMAMLTGSVGGLAMVAGSLAVLRAKIDDPLDAVSVHGCGGVVGVLLRPFVDSSGVQFDMVGPQCVGIVCIVSWTATITAFCFLALKQLGLLRVSEEEEKGGCDLALLSLDAHAQGHASGDVHTHEPAVIAVGSIVVVHESFLSNNKETKILLKKEMSGVVKQVDSDGDARIDFGKHGLHWVFKKNFVKLRGDDAGTSTEVSRRHSAVALSASSTTTSPRPTQVPSSRSTEISMAEDDQDDQGRQRRPKRRTLTPGDGEALGKKKSEKSGDRRQLSPARVESESVEAAAAPRKQKRPPKFPVDDSAMGA